MGDIWNDFCFNLPSTDERVKEKLPLPHCTYISRCDKCSGKCTRSCSACGSNRGGCTTCGGSGKVACSSCKGCGGFQHLATLKVSWQYAFEHMDFSEFLSPGLKHCQGPHVLPFGPVRRSHGRKNHQLR